MSDPLPPSPPVIVGAVGGSGTRVVTRLIRSAGVFMGSRLNEAEDSEPVMAFYDEWLRPYLEGGGELPPGDRRAAEARFREALREHLAGHGGSRAWGVKVPRNILALPLWHDRFPGLRFVHVVRNGLDMAYSEDRNQLRMFGDLILSREEQQRIDPVRESAYWRRVNLEAAAFGESQLRGLYLRLRFEDVCADPTGAYARLCEFLELSKPATRPRRATRSIAAPATIDRWMEHPEHEVAEVVSAGRQALERFGYLS